MNTKVCNKCQKEQSVSNFHKAARNVDGFFHTCKPCRKEIDREYYSKSDKKQKLTTKHSQNRINIQLYKDDKSCKFCGESANCCLDFHHRNEKDKTFTISQRVNDYSWERILEEIQKCDVVCCNCHRKLHAGLI